MIDNNKQVGSTAVEVNSSIDIGRVVKAHRQKAKLTQLKLAELAGVGKTVVFDIEKGKATVKFETLLKVLKSLNISVMLSSSILKYLEHST